MKTKPLLPRSTRICFKESAQQQAVPAVRIRFAEEAGLVNFRENLFQGERYIERLMAGIDRPAQVHVMRNGSALYLYLQPV